MNYYDIHVYAARRFSPTHWLSSALPSSIAPNRQIWLTIARILLPADRCSAARCYFFLSRSGFRFSCYIATDDEEATDCFTMPISGCQLHRFPEPASPAFRCEDGASYAAYPREMK